MFKSSNIMYLYAQTSVHIGSGDSLGVIDLAIQRERYTGFPVAPSSGLKGALRDWFENSDSTLVTQIFGPDTDASNSGSEHAGAVAFTDGRILLFPVRSLKGVFAWITCPLILERYKRDLNIVGENLNFTTPVPNIGDAIGGKECVVKDDTIILEEYSFTHQNDEISDLIEHLEKIIPDKTWKERLNTHLIVLHDDDFIDFVQYSTEVQARIKLGKGKTTTADDGNLFYQENLPPECLFYTLVMAHDSLDGQNVEANVLLKEVKKLDKKYLQIGGDETVGKGIMKVKFLNGEGNA